MVADVAPVRLGILGAGFIARYHLSMLRGAAVPYELVAVHDPDATRSGKLAGDFGIAAVVDEQAVFDGVDAVYVCTWTAEHPRLVAEAAARGVAVFCEKPLAVDLASARGMVDAVVAAGVTNQVGLVLRDSPAFRFLRELVHDERSGRVMGVVFRDDQYLPTQGMYESSWRADVALAGAGTLLEHSIHDLDLLEWLFGPVEAVSATTAMFHELEGIDDLATVLVRFASGASATLTSVWHDVLSRPSQRRMEVLCERAVYTLEGDVFGPVHWHDDEGAGTAADSDLVARLRDRGLRLRNPDEAFLAAVASGAPVAPDFATALRAHVLVEACYRSAASGGAPVPIEAATG